MGRPVYLVGIYTWSDLTTRRNIVLRPAEPGFGNKKLRFCGTKTACQPLIDYSETKGV